MNLNRFLLLSALLIALVISAGCSGGTVADPVIPSNQNNSATDGPTIDDIERLIQNYNDPDPDEYPWWDCERYFSGDADIKLLGVDVSATTVDIELRDGDCGAWSSDVEMVFDFDLFLNMNGTIPGTKTKIPFVGTLYSGEDMAEYDYGFFWYKLSWLYLMNEKQETDPVTGEQYQNLTGYLIKTVEWKITWKGQEYEGLHFWSADIDTSEVQ